MQFMKLCEHFNYLTDFTEKFTSAFDISDWKSNGNVFLWNLRSAEIQTKTSDEISTKYDHIRDNKFVL